jgi:hypothetical protein
MIGAPYIAKVPILAGTTLGFDVNPLTDNNGKSFLAGVSAK